MPQTSPKQSMVLGSADLHATLVELGLAQACLRRAYGRLQADGCDSVWIDALDKALNDIANATDYAIGQHFEMVLVKMSEDSPATLK